MTDLIMCISDTCPYRDTCFRTQSKPSTHQSYSNFEYTCNEDSGFGDYIPILKENKNI